MTSVIESVQADCLPKGTTELPSIDVIGHLFGTKQDGIFTLSVPIPNNTNNISIASMAGIVIFSDASQSKTITFDNITWGPSIITGQFHLDSAVPVTGMCILNGAFQITIG